MVRTAIAGEIDVGAGRFEGILVYVTGNRLVTVDDAGRELLHSVPSDAEVWYRGKRRVVADLIVGSLIRIMVRPDDESVAAAVTCLHIPGAELD